MTGWKVVAALGTVLIESSYLPQMIRLHHLKEADEFSPWFPLMNFFGRILALIYCIASGENTLGLGFLVGILLRATLFSQVLYYRRKNANWIKQSAQSGFQFAEKLLPHLPNSAASLKLRRGSEL